MLGQSCLKLNYVCLCPTCENRRDTLIQLRTDVLRASTFLSPLEVIRAKKVSEQLRNGEDLFEQARQGPVVQPKIKPLKPEMTLDQIHDLEKKWSEGGSDQHTYIWRVGEGYKLPEDIQAIYDLFPKEEVKELVSCPSCSGTGKVANLEAPRNILDTVPCYECKGTGKVTDAPRCSFCEQVTPRILLQEGIRNFKIEVEDIVVATDPLTVDKKVTVSSEKVQACPSCAYRIEPIKNMDGEITNQNLKTYSRG